MVVRCAVGVLRDAVRLYPLVLVEDGVNGQLLGDDWAVLFAGMGHLLRGIVLVLTEVVAHILVCPNESCTGEGCQPDIEQRVVEVIEDCEPTITVVKLGEESRPSKYEAFE